MSTTNPPYPVPRLLISVRDTAEAETAVAAGVDWIDVKEPSRGALGRADFRTIEAIVACVAGRTPVSAALGDLDEIDSRVVDRVIGIHGLSLVKIGLADTADSPEWRTRWLRIVRRFADSMSVAAVVYADWEQANAPSPQSVVAVGAGHCRAILVDTYFKQGPSTVDLLAPSCLQDLIDMAKRHEMLTVIAGRLTVESVQVICRTAPDLIGIRGAVCRGDRTNTIDGSLIRKIQTSLRKCNGRAS